MSDIKFLILNLGCKSSKTYLHSCINISKNNNFKFEKAYELDKSDVIIEEYPMFYSPTLNVPLHRKNG